MNEFNQNDMNLNINPNFENQNNEVKEKKGVPLIIVIIACIAMLALGLILGYLLCNKEAEVPAKPQEEPVVEKINISEEQAKEMHQLYIFGNPFRIRLSEDKSEQYSNFYVGSKIDINTVNKTAIFVSALYSLADNPEQISNSSIIAQVKKLYNYDMTNFKMAGTYGELDTNDISPAGGSSFSYNETTDSWSIEGATGEPSGAIFTKYETDEKNVYIYDEYYYVGEVIEDNNEEYEKDPSIDLITKYNVYADSNKETKIGTMTVIDSNEDYKKINDFTKVTYKHTFTKDTSGNFYWVSSELVK